MKKHVLIYLVLLISLAYAGDRIDCDPEMYNHLPQNFIETATFASGGQYVLSGHRDLYVRLWDIKTAQLLKSFNHGPLNWGLRVAISPDNKTIVSSGYKCNKSVTKFWNIETETMRKKIPTFSEVLTFSPCGKFVLTEAKSNLNIWDSKTGLLENKIVVDQLNTFEKFFNKSIGTIANKMFEKRTDRIRDIVVSSNKQFIACAIGKVIKLFQFNNVEDTFEFRGHTENITKIVLSRDINLLASGSDHRLNGSDTAFLLLKIWNLQERILERNLYLNNKYMSPIQTLRFTPDGKQICVGLWNKTIIIFDIHSGELFKIVHLKVRPYVFSFDCNFFLSVGNKLEVFETFSGKYVKTLWRAN